MKLFADRVKETSSSSGTGAIVTQGPVQGYQSFAAAFGPASQPVAYCITEQVGGKWEVGYGTFNGSIGLTRAAVLSSSNAGALVNFAPGPIKDVSCLIPTAAVTTSLVLATGQSSASFNTTLFQAALDITGEVRITNPGTYYINSVLYIRSNTDVYLGDGVEIKVADNANCGVFTNTAARLTGTAISAGNITWTGSSPNFAATINQSGLSNDYPAGSFIGVLGITDRGYQGVWEVLTATASGLTFKLASGCGGSGIAAGNSIKIFRADTNITIKGPGCINGNGLNQTLYGVGDPRGCVVWFRNAKNVSIDGIQVKGGITWTLGSNNVNNYRVTNITGNTAYLNSKTTDIVHLSGQHNQVVIENLNCTSIDNIVGLTIDLTTGTAYDFPFQSPGDMYDISVRNIHGISSAAICGIYGPAAYRFHNLTFDNISGEGTSAFQLANYSYTNQNNCNGDKLLVKNLHANTSGPQLILTGIQNWGSIILDDVFCKNPQTNMVALQCTGNITQITLKNLFCEGTFTVPAIEITAPTIGALAIGNVEGQLLAAGVPFTLHSGTAAIGRIAYDNVSVAAASGSSSLHSVTGSGVVTSMVFNNCFFSGSGLTGSMFNQGSLAAYVAVTFNNCQLAGAQALFVGANTNAAITVFVNNLLMAGACANAGLFSGPTNLYVNGYTEIIPPSNNPFKILTATKYYNFSFENINRTADLIQYLSGNLRIRGSSARTALANVNSPQMGDIFYDLTSNTMKGRNSSNIWVSIF
jgi:hypothetical protein